MGDGGRQRRIWFRSTASPILPSARSSSTGRGNGCVKGWQDLRRAPLVSFTYGVLAAVTGYV